MISFGAVIARAEPTGRQQEEENSFLNEAGNGAFDALNEDVLAQLKNAGDFFSAGNFEEACKNYRDCLDKLPNRYPVLLRILHCYDHLCDWPGRETITAEILTSIEAEADGKGPVTGEPLCYQSLPLAPQLVKKLATRRVLEALSKWAQIQKPILSSTRPESPAKVRIGYVSLDFRSHSAGVPLWPFLAMHDRDTFEIIAYDLDPTEDSQSVRDATDVYRDLSNQPDEKIAETIVSDRLTILVDTTRHVRGTLMWLPGVRLAPVTVSGWGYGGTTGGDQVDWIFGDVQTITENEQSVYCENVSRLENYHPITPLTSQAAKKETKKGKEDSSKIVYGCFCKHYKIDPTVWKAWMEILRNVPEGELRLSPGNPTSQSNLLRWAEKDKVDKSRIVFLERVPYDAHLARLLEIDLILDNPRMGGSASIPDGLKAGVPALSINLPGPENRSGVSLLNAFGTAEQIAKNWPEYVASACRISLDDQLRQSARDSVQTIREKSALFDIDRFVGNLETLLLKFIDGLDK